MNTPDELERLLAATQGEEWRVSNRDPVRVVDGTGAYIALCDPHHKGDPLQETRAALIVAAINALPGLIESARRVEILAPYAKLGLAVSESWPSEFGDIVAFDVFDMLRDSGVIVKQPEPYDPKHHDYIEDCQPGEEWYKRAVNIGNVRAALKGNRND